MSSPPLHSSHLFTNFVVGISFLPEKYFFKWSRFCQEWHRLYPVLASVSVMMPFLSLSLAHHWCDEKAICFFSSPWPHTTLHALVRFFFFYYYYHLVLSEKVHSIEGIYSILRFHNTYDARSLAPTTNGCIWWKSKCVHTHTLSHRV